MRAQLAASLLVGLGLVGCLGTGPQEPVEQAAGTFAGGFSATPVYAGQYDTTEDWSVVLQPGPHGILPGEVVALDTGVDGAAVQIGLVRPEVPDGTPVPVIVLASPYFPPLQAIDLAALEPRLTDNFVPHGYAVAFVAVRGSSDSGGCSDLMGPKERADLDQAVEWLGTQPWSNGNVGLIGVSYDGSTPWEAAATGNAHVKTIVPISGLSDIFNLEFRNGTVEWRMLGLVSVSYWAGGWAFGPFDGRSPEHTAQGIVCPEVVGGLEASFEAALTGERDAMGYWNERNSRPGVEENYGGSVLLVHGLQDWNVDPHHAYPWVNQLEAKGIVVKHLLGQWGHAWPDGSYLDDDVRRYDFAEILLHWFDYWLKQDTKVDLGPRAQVQDSNLAWRNEQTWPPRDTVPMPLYLAPGGALVAEPATGEERVPVGPHGNAVTGDPVSFPDPRLCGACAVWATEPLEEDLRFAGLPRVHVTVTPSGPGGNLAAHLYAIHEDGTWQRLGWTQMDLRFHGGGEEAQTVVPGQPIQALMQLEPLDAFVPAGSRLALVLSTGMQHDRVSAGLGQPALVHAGGEGSVVVLDTSERGPEAFFDAPS